MTPDPPPGLRALLIGAVGAGVIGAGVLYCNMVLQGSRIASYFNTPAALILFFFLILIVNTGLGLARRSWMLSRAELALIYIMWIVATAIPEWGLTSFLLPDLTSALYYATPENNWRELLLPLFPDWIIPAPDPGPIAHLYEGAPKDLPIPWDFWLRPLWYWLPFVLALYLAMICCMVLLRKQWVDHERLVFPLVQVPLAMIQDDPARPGALLKPFFKNPLMWLGFSVPALLQSINGLNPYFPAIPRLYWGTSIALFRNTIDIPIVLSFQMLGFSYFINRDIAFGLCFFYLLNTVQQGLFNILGLQEVDPVLGAYSRYTGSIIVHQGFGAIIVLVLFGLWTARAHLGAVWRKAWHQDPQVDDGDEILSYRAALVGLLGSLVFMGVWLWQSGLPAWITPIYLFLTFVLFIGITRIVAEGGVAFIFAPMVVSDFVAAGFGTRALGPQGIVAFAFTYIWASDILTFVMASCANSLKLVEEAVKQRRRLVLGAMFAAILVTLASSVWAMIALAYRYGGVNTDGFFFNYVNLLPFENAASRLQELEGPHWKNWGHTAMGAGIMTLLMMARQRFLWWPFHPLGFPISAVFGTMFFSVLLAWLLKSAALKYGGPSLYLKTRPFFLGLILGQFVTAGLWLLISYFTGVQGGYNYLSGYF
ncbi:MAG: hypothetical protein EXS58_06160 [Candidatus Latescibacteria bacterium]|nr:hypothetical protein [Candidatus Latescibacterota bacterium]